MSKEHNIYLIGPMGAGKTSVGQLLAKRTHRTFYDSDIVITERTGVSVSWIFEVETEAGFRKREAEVIADLTQLHNIVLATGGGAIITPSSREPLQNTGMVVYLKVSLEEQLSRTARRKGGRPLIEEVDDREAALRHINQEREPIYESMADLTYDTDRLSPNKIVECIINDITKLKKTTPNETTTK